MTQGGYQPSMDAEKSDPATPEPLIENHQNTTRTDDPRGVVEATTDAVSEAVKGTPESPLPAK